MTPETAYLSAPLWLIDWLHIITLTAHFVAMNFLLTGVIAVLFGKFTDRWNHPTVQKILKLLPTAMAFTISFGVAPLLFTQLVYHKQVYSASIIGAWYWLMILVAALILYYLLYLASFKLAKSRNIGVILSLALACIGYISFIYSNVFSLAENPALMHTLYAADQQGLSLNPEIGSWIFRWLHMLLGAITVGGFAVGYIGRDNEEGYQVGKFLYFFGMLAAMLFGFLYMMTLVDYLKEFMRSSAIWWLTASIFLSLGSLHFYFKKRFLPAGAMLLVSLVGMVVIRHEVRLMRLRDVFDPATLPVKPEWGVITLFLFCFLLAVALLWYMITRIRRVT